MDDKVKVIQGDHKGKVGIVTGILWASNITLIKTDDGEDISVKPIDVITIN